MAGYRASPETWHSEDCDISTGRGLQIHFQHSMKGMEQLLERRSKNSRIAPQLLVVSQSFPYLVSKSQKYQNSWEILSKRNVFLLSII